MATLQYDLFNQDRTPELSPLVIELGLTLDLIVEQHGKRPRFADMLKQQAAFFHANAVETKDPSGFEPGSTASIGVCVLSSGDYQQLVQGHNRDSLVDYNPARKLLLLRDVPANPLFLGLLGHAALSQLTIIDQVHTDLETEKQRRFVLGVSIMIELLETVLHRGGSFKYSVLERITNLIESATARNIETQIQSFAADLEKVATTSEGEAEQIARFNFLTNLVSVQLGGFGRAEIFKR